MATAAYAGPTTIAMDLSNLGSSTTYVAGRSSAEVNNSSNKYLDAIVFGRYIVGTTPTLQCQFNCYIWGADVSLTTTAIDTLVGTDANKTLTNTTVLGSALVLAASPAILVNTSNITYDLHPFSAANALGLQFLPLFWGLFVAHNMTAALKTDAGNTNSFRYLGVTTA